MRLRRRRDCVRMIQSTDLVASRGTGGSATAVIDVGNRDSLTVR